MKAKATKSKQARIRSSLLMWMIIILCIAALALIVYNVVVTNYWYVVSYIVAIVLGTSYVLVKLNELYGSYITCDKQYLYMRCWDNCFFPYQTLFNSHFFGELLPSKCVSLKVPTDEITHVFIGTKSFICRNTSDNGFLDAVALYDGKKHQRNQKLLEKMDILFVKTIDDSVFMNVSDFDAKSIMRIMKSIGSMHPEIEFKLNGRAYRKFNASEQKE